VIEQGVGATMFSCTTKEEREQWVARLNGCIKKQQEKEVVQLTE
jgi:hypothetical protein